MAKTPSASSSDKPKAPKPAAAKDKDKDKAKAKDKAQAAVEETPKAKAPEPPRPPADPRLKVLKKFHGKFLPRGPLRDRHKELMTRWNSGPEHGGVTVEELKSLHADWLTSRQKTAKKKPVAV